MKTLYNQLLNDHRYREGMNSCINCGTCTAICPAAEFYNYDPRKIVELVQRKDEEELKKLLESEFIWYCGQCLSCITRCPRKNAPALIIQALRELSINNGLFIKAEKGRQQYALNRILCNNILETGYGIHPTTFKYVKHPEAGTVQGWIEDNLEDLHSRLGSNYNGNGTGVLRKTSKETLDELKRIFDITGATKRMEIVEKYSKEYAKEQGISLEEFFDFVYTANEKEHNSK